MDSLLRVRAEDQEDLQIVAAYLQDALVTVADLDYLPREQQFVIMANRFRWENTDQPLMVEDADGGAAQPRPVYERVKCAIRVEGVTHVCSKGLDRKNRDQVLVLLTMELRDLALLVHFSGGCCLRLDLQPGWRCCVKDMGDPWPTFRCPSHLLDEGSPPVEGGFGR